MNYHRTLSRGLMCTDVAHLHNQPFQQYLLVNKTLQLQNQLKWWSLLSLIRFHCSVLAGCSEVFHIRVHFCGIIFYFTARLHVLTDRRPSSLSAGPDSQSRQWSKWPNTHHYFLWEEAKKLVTGHWKVSASRSKPALSLYTRTQWFFPPCSNSGPSVSEELRIPVLPQNLKQGCAPPPTHPASVQWQGTEGWQLGMELGKAKPGHSPQQGLSSFLPEGHMLITGHSVVLKRLPWFSLWADMMFHKKGFFSFLQVDSNWEM